MKSTQHLTFTFCLLIATLTLGGCASNSGCNSGTGLFGTNILQGQPIRTTVRSWFQGDSCDTCNTPAGQLAPPCENCIGGGTQVFSNQIGGSQTQSLYGAPAINGVQPNGGISSQFAPQPGPAVGSGTSGIIPDLGSGTRSTGNLGALATPPTINNTPETIVSTFEVARMRIMPSALS